MNTYKNNKFRQRMMRLLIAASAAVHLSNPSHAADTIELKGIRLGMTRSELEEAYPHIAAWHIADVFSYTQNGPSIFFEEDKIVKLNFLFRPYDFQHVARAVVTKYPKTKCQKSAVKNRLGASFTQVECFVRGGDSELTVTKFDGTTETSSLELVSRNWRARMERREAEDAKRRSKDI